MTPIDLTPTALDRIFDRTTELHELTAQLRDEVTHARADGATWQELADALRVTKQAAQQRYGRKNHWTAADTAAGHTPSMLAQP